MRRQPRPGLERWPGKSNGAVFLADAALTVTVARRSRARRAGTRPRYSQGKRRAGVQDHRLLELREAAGNTGPNGAERDFEDFGNLSIGIIFQVEEAYR